jgi:hypothetical protein
MPKHNDPNYRDARTFTEEELNPNRPHEYRKTHDGVSPVGRIHEIMKEKREKDPEGYKESIRKGKEKELKTKSMQRRAKDILNTVIKLTDEEKEVFLNGLKTEGELTLQDAILYAQATKAVKEKDTAAAVFVRDTSGQKPKDIVENTVSIDNLLKNNGILEEEED